MEPFLLSNPFPASRHASLGSTGVSISTEPSFDGLQPLSAGETIETKHSRIALDPRSGAIVKLVDKKTGREWASARQPLALFAYQTLSKADYDRFFTAYLKSNADWAPKDFGKPNIERFGAQSRTWLPTVVSSRQAASGQGHRLLVHLKIDDAESEKAGRVAWPRKMYLDIRMPDSEPAINIEFSWFDKAANRLPEALWLTFQPMFPNRGGWLLDKSGSWISPFDVIQGGNRTMHAVASGLRYADDHGAVAIETKDAPLVVVGERMPVYFSNNQPDLSRGFHFSLFNNGWGTNYVQWFGEAMKFRFRIVMQS